MMKVFIVLFISLFVFDVHAATHSRTLRVLSYNVKGLPDIITKMDSDRFGDIGRILAERRKAGTAPDIVVFQEAFIGRTKDLITKSGYPYFAKGPNATDLTESGLVQQTVYGAGLYILSEFPILESKKVAYDLRLCADADCGANKGALMVSLDVPGLPKPLKVFDTHAQSIDRYDSHRSKQFEIFSRFIAKNVTDEPYLVGGDFNSRPKDNAFTDWVRLTKTTAAGGYCVANSPLCQIDPNTDVAKAYQDAIDHIFFSQAPAASGVTVRPITVMRNFGDPVAGRALSDHLGYEAEFEISWSD